MAGSLVLSLTLIPVLASLILKPKAEKDTRFVSWLKARYRPILDWALARKRRVLGIALVALAASLALFPFLGKEFMPQLQRSRASCEFQNSRNCKPELSRRTGRPLKRTRIDSKRPQIAPESADLGNLCSIH